MTLPFITESLRTFNDDKCKDPMVVNADDKFVMVAFVFNKLELVWLVTFKLETTALLEVKFVLFRLVLARSLIKELLELKLVTIALDITALVTV